VHGFAFRVRPPRDRQMRTVTHTVLGGPLAFALLGTCTACAAHGAPPAASPGGSSVEPATPPTGSTVGSPAGETVEQADHRESMRIYGWAALGIGSFAGVIALWTSGQMLYDLHTRTANCTSSKVCSPAGLSRVAGEGRARPAWLRRRHQPRRGLLMRPPWAASLASPVMAGCILVTGGTAGYTAPDAGFDAGAEAGFGDGSSGSLTCLSAGDCAEAGVVCCVDLSASAPVMRCQAPPCGGAYPIQLCTSSTECGDAGACTSQSCMLGAAVVSQRICGETPSCSLQR
jgi:hypothetical protein